MALSETVANLNRAAVNLLCLVWSSGAIESH
jgi:hypothetical protein